MFFQAIEKLGERDNHEQDEENQEDKGIMLENNQDQHSGLEDFKEDNEGELDFFAKQRKMAERKELAQLDHAQMVYEDVKFNLYR